MDIEIQVQGNVGDMRYSLNLSWARSAVPLGHKSNRKTLWQILGIAHIADYCCSKFEALESSVMYLSFG